MGIGLTPGESTYRERVRTGREPTHSRRARRLTTDDGLQAVHSVQRSGTERHASRAATGEIGRVYCVPPSVSLHLHLSTCVSLMSISHMRSDGLTHNQHDNQHGNQVSNQHGNQVSNQVCNQVSGMRRPRDRDAPPCPAQL